MNIKRYTKAISFFIAGVGFGSVPLRDYLQSGDDTVFVAMIVLVLLSLGFMAMGVLLALGIIKEQTIDSTIADCYSGIKAEAGESRGPDLSSTDDDLAQHLSTGGMPEKRIKSEQPNKAVQGTTRGLADPDR